MPKVAGDAMALPLADESVDGVVISFGLRNVADPDAALREFRRVTRPGGTLVVCEFSSPTLVAVPHRLHRVPDEGAAPDRARGEQQPRGLRLPRRVDPGVAGPGRAGGAVQDAGWADVAWHNLTGGIVALHRARRV